MCLDIDEWRRAKVLAYLSRKIDDSLRLAKFLSATGLLQIDWIPSSESFFYNFRLLLRLMEHIPTTMEMPPFEDVVRFVGPRMVPPLGDRKVVDVFTCGSNVQLSLGNPLGTRKMKRIYFASDGSRHFNVETVRS